MSEEKEGPESGQEGVGTGADPAAISLALGGASREDARTFLKKQGALIDDQRHHLHEQFKQLHLGLWEKRLGVLLRVATLVVGLAVAGGLAFMVWDAAHSKGLIIEPFSVPPELAARGLTGEVIASQVIDKLTTMTRSESSRAVQSYANNWGNNIKVEIPETGVSIGELRNFLRDWLGHDIRITGEVYKTTDGIAVTARTGGDEGATFTGKESDLDALAQKAAEHVYEVTQPYRYANYLDRNYDPKGLDQRVAKAIAIYRKLIAGDDPLERAWAWNGLGTIAFRYQYDNRLSAAYYRRAIAEVPDLTIGYFALSARTGSLGQEEATYQNLRQAMRLMHRDTIPDINPHYLAYARLNGDGTLASSLGDYAAGIPLQKKGAELPDDFSVIARGNFIGSALVQMARQHDLGAVRAYVRDRGWREISVFTYGSSRIAYDIERQDWQDLLAMDAAWRARLAREKSSPQAPNFINAYNSTLRINFAFARAQLGDFAGAEAEIAPVPGDNDGGVRTRPLIAELRGQHARADWWFARSEAQTPSLPQTDVYWGQVLLKRGAPDKAIEKFARANKLGPRYADPLEGWGEALMAKSQSHLALEKFAEADKYAPSWARLHLKWGQALYYAGKRDDAKAQFARAAQLDLTPSEKSELAKAPHG